MKGDTRRSGSWKTVGAAYYARVRMGKGRKRFEPRMLVDSDEAADVRSSQIAHIVDLALAVNREDYARTAGAALGKATSDRDVAIIMKAARETCADAAKGAAVYTGITFEQFALRWTSGQLHTDHPDHVGKKQSEGDESILKNRIRPLVGPIPLALFSLDDADRVMRELPRHLSTAYRRAVAQVVHRILTLAVWPAKIIKTSPLPKGWLPKIGKPKAKSFLYPKEEAALLGNKEIPLGYRVLVGMLCREGFRKSEARRLEWRDLDLEVGTVTLDENKTETPRSWPLSADVVRALKAWQPKAPEAGPFDGLDVQHLGEMLRGWLRKSGVTRPQLFADTDKRMHFRAHDTRSTFVTLSLAAERSEAWVMRRTAHKSSTMIARYTVAAANARELGLGPLAPLDRAIPELGENRVKRAGTKRTKRTTR